MAERKPMPLRTRKPLFTGMQSIRLTAGALLVTLFFSCNGFSQGPAAKAQTTLLFPERCVPAATNPLIGFAPGASYITLAEDSQLVYVNLTWRELEPQKGVYDFAAFEKENHLARWRNEGKRVVFRFACDIPRSKSHMDIPDWLYEETGDGDWYDTDYGKGYAPNYANEYLIERHRMAVEALGLRYGGDDFFFYVQLGSLGHWGEWHVDYGSGIRPLPQMAIREQYVLPYVESFPNAWLLMRRPFSHAHDHGFGLYNDMTGHPGETERWLDWIEHGGAFEQTGEDEGALVPMPSFWKSAPAGGELTSSMSMEELLSDALTTTLYLVERSHMSFLGPKVPNQEELARFPDGAKRLRTLLGYDLYIEQVRLQEDASGLVVTLYWKNDGIAPFYGDWPVTLYLLNSAGVAVETKAVALDLCAIMPGEEAITSETVLDVQGLSEGVYHLAVAILDPMLDKPAVDFSMHNTRDDQIYVLGEYRR